MRLRALGLDLSVVQAAETAVDAAPIGAGLAATLMEIPTQVQVSEFRGCCLLDLGRFGRYRHDPQKQQIAILRPPERAEHLDEVLHGPLLMHALAHRGCHVMHASAIRRQEEGVTVLTAESGVGKSTLAAIATRMGWQRVADDLLPLRRGSAGLLLACPRLRQPKLDAAEQYPFDAPEELPVRRILRLLRGELGAIRPLDGVSSTRLILENTVATRVYPKHALAAHLQFAAQIGQQVAGHRIEALELQVADRPGDIVGAVAEALARIAQT